MKLAYLCSQYPAISHTFVLREVNALRRRGVEIATFSIRRAGADHLLADADRAAFQSTFAILPPRWGRLLRAHLKLATESPSTYVFTLAQALRLAPAGWSGLLWQFFYFAEAVVLWNECRERDIRHIHVHLANVAADVALLTANIGSELTPERPWSWSFTMHGPTELYDVSRYRLAEKLRRARFVVCISDFTRGQLMRLSSPDAWERLHVVHVGIPIEQFTRSPNGATPTTDRMAPFNNGAPRAEGQTGPFNNGPAPAPDPTVLFIGRQVNEKGQAVLLEATALLAKRGRAINVTLAGEGPARGELERLAEQLGISSRVSFPGAVGQEEIRALYAGASIFCLPSFAEGLPGVLMEAMAMEVPVVSTTIAGIPELIDDGRTGLLVAPGRADELAAALELLLTDASLCRELTSSAREKIVSEFNTERSAEQLHELFARWLPESSDPVTG